MDGSLSFSASLFLSVRYLFPYWSEVSFPNSLSFGFRFFLIIRSCSLVVRFAVIGMVLGFPPLAVVGFTVLCSRSMSLTLRLHSSTGLSPVSMLSCSFVPSTVPALAISIKSFSLVGSATFLAS